MADDKPTASASNASRTASKEKQYEVLADMLVLSDVTYSKGSIIRASQLPANQVEGFIDLGSLKEIKG